MFRVKNICVIIAFFLLIWTSTGLGEDVEVDASDTIVAGGKAAAEETTTETFSDALDWDGFKSDVSKTKETTQINLVRQFLIAIGFVALLGCGTFYFSKKVGPKLAGSKGKNILVSDSISLGKNKTLHIVEIDNKKLLIGCTANSINTLTELSGSFQEILQTCQDDENES